MTDENLPGSTLENVLGTATKQKRNRNVLDVLEPDMQPLVHNTYQPIELCDNLELTFNYLKGIFGYKIVKDKEFLILKSIHATSDNDIFKFRIVNKNRIQIVETEYFKRWEYLYRHYLVEKQSISAFIAAVTLELFNNRRSQ